LVRSFAGNHRQAANACRRESCFAQAVLCLHRPLAGEGKPGPPSLIASQGCPLGSRIASFARCFVRAVLCPHHPLAGQARPGPPGHIASQGCPLGSRFASSAKAPIFFPAALSGTRCFVQAARYPLLPRAGPNPHTQLAAPACYTSGHTTACTPVRFHATPLNTTGSCHCFGAQFCKEPLGQASNACRGACPVVQAVICPPSSCPRGRKAARCLLRPHPGRRS
jgi:hypothetical protein